MPSSLWHDDVLHISGDMQDVYETELRNRKLLERASAYDGKQGIHGGESVEETNEHFCLRYLNSASRVQCVILDPKKAFDDIPRDLLLTLSSHRISILDLPCGAGAGTIATLVTLRELRLAGILPFTPLSVRILGADFSRQALSLYESLLGQLEPRLAAAGISVYLETRIWDARSVQQTNQLIDHYLGANPACSEFLVLVANFSGASKAQFQEFEESFRQIWIRLSGGVARCSTILWVEPYRSDKKKSTGQYVLKKIWEIVSPYHWFRRAQATRNRVHGFECELHLRLINKNVPSGVMVHKYSREHKA